jgi:protein-disulfide isomerase
MNLSRRVLLLSSLGSFLLAGAFASAYAQTVDVAELMAPGPLPDRVLGNDKAPITVIEYASMTCSHCARFYNEVFQPFKKKYIDTGKVRFIMREFPLDPLAASASALARCQSDDKYFPTVEVLFEQQKDWAFVDDPSKALFAMAQKFGFTQQSFEACLSDSKLSQALDDGRGKAKEKFGVKGVPAFFINGERMQGEKTLDNFDKMLEPLLKGS